MQNKRTGVYSREQLTRLLHPQSIAVIGASTRAGSFGKQVLHQHGALRRPLLSGERPLPDDRATRPAIPTSATCRRSPDCAVITAAREAVEEIVLDCAKAGVGGAIIFASGYAETGKEDRIAQQERLAAIARETGLRIVGPNCIGVVNAMLDSRVTFMDITPIPRPERNAVGVISQSGALGMALAQGVVRGLSVSHVLTSGNSCDVDMADYVNYLATDPDLRLDRLRVRGHGDPRTAAAGRRERLGGGQAAGHLQDGDRRAGRRGGDVAHRVAGRVARVLSRGVPARRRDRGRRFRGADGNGGVLRQGAAAEGPGRGGGGGLGRRGDHGDRPGGAAWRADAAADAGGEGDPGIAHPGVRLLAQPVRRHRRRFSAIPKSLGICANALLGDPQYGVLVSPLTYGYAPSAKRPQVYNALAEQHGKMACVVWQTEWQDGPGVVEANQCDRVALFRSMNACFAALAAWHWRADKRAAGAQRVAATPPEVIAQTQGADRGGGRPDADGTAGEGGARALRRAGGRRAADAVGR